MAKYLRDYYPFLSSYRTSDESLAEARGMSLHDFRQRRFGSIAAMWPLAQQIRAGLAKAKVTVDPPINEISLNIAEDNPKHFEIAHRSNGQPCRLRVNLPRPLDEVLSVPLDNMERGEWSIRVTTELLDYMRETGDSVRGFPFQVFEAAIERFRAEDYSITWPPSGIRKLDASPLTIRFIVFGSCMETKVTMVFYLGKEELHRREVIKFGPGRFDAARYTTNCDLYDEEIRVLSMDISQPVPVISYADLPESVRQHMPSNQQLRAAWGTPCIPKTSGGP